MKDQPMVRHDDNDDVDNRCIHAVLRYIVQQKNYVDTD